MIMDPLGGSKWPLGQMAPNGHQMLNKVEVQGNQLRMLKNGLGEFIECNMNQIF